MNNKNKNSTNIKDEIYVENPPIGLDAQNAGSKANLSTSGKYQLYYDVNGTTPVVGGKLLLGGLVQSTKNDAAVIDKIINDMWDQINSAASPIPYSDYLDYHLNQLNTKRKYRNLLGSVTVICASMAEDITYLDGSLYSDDSVINSDNYKLYDDNNQPLDAGIAYERYVTSMVNAAKDQYSPAARRIAKLAKTIKSSVLAQMNDTNPFYNMPLAEIYDRLVDYFRLINRAVTLVKNADAWLHAGDMLQVGAQQAFYDYRQIYTSKLVLEISDYLARLKTALVGQYYDEVGLTNYIKFGTMGLNPTQNGSVRFIQPIISNVMPIDNAGAPIAIANKDYTGSLIFLPCLKIHSQFVKTSSYDDIIIQILDQTTQLLYSADVTRIQTALAAFNGLPQLGDIIWSGFDVKNDLIALLSSNSAKVMGTLVEDTVTKFRGVSSVGEPASATVEFSVHSLSIPYISHYKASGAVAPGENYPIMPNVANRPSKIALGLIAHFNGVGSYYAASPNGTKPYTGPKNTIDLSKDPTMYQVAAESDILSAKDPYLPARLYALSFSSVMNLRDITSRKYTGIYFESMLNAAVSIPLRTETIDRYNNNIIRTSSFIGKVRTGDQVPLDFFKALSVLHRPDVIPYLDFTGVPKDGNDAFNDVLLKNFATGYSGLHTYIADNLNNYKLGESFQYVYTDSSGTANNKSGILNLLSNNIYDLMPANNSYTAFGSSGHGFVGYILGNNRGTVSGLKVAGVNTQTTAISVVNTTLQANGDLDSLDNACVDVLGWLPQSFSYAGIYNNETEFSIETTDRIALGGFQSINNLGIPEHVQYDASFDCNIGMAVYKHSLKAVLD